MRRNKILVLELRVKEIQKDLNSYVYAIFPFPRALEPVVYWSKEKENFDIDKCLKRLTQNSAEPFCFYFREDIIDFFEKAIKEGYMRISGKNYKILEKKLYSFLC
jgi:hypothetical protein